jgi:DNA-binding transcriptional MocR family regulator
MPVKVSDYSKSSIYKLCCNDTAITDVYIGSTTAFSKRKYTHKSSCTRTTSSQYNYYVYQFIRANGGWDNWSMILVEDYNASTKRNLELRERYWLETLKATLNKQLPTRAPQEYYQEYCKENKEKIKLVRKEYDKENKEKMKLTRKEFYQENKEKIKLTNKEYYQENKEKIKLTNKDYYQKNKENKENKENKKD